MEGSERKAFVELKIPVKMDNGKIETVQFYKGQDSPVLEPSKGGIRYHWNVNPHEVQALAKVMHDK